MADEELIAKDLPEYIATLKELDDQVSEISQRVGGLIQKIDDENVSTSEGISFLEVKTQLLLSYLINIVYYMLLKTDGKQIEGDPTIDRLVEIRTVLEKLRPIDQKMKYQIDKLIKMVTTGMTVGDNDPLRFKPNPDNMATKFGDDEEDDSDDSTGETYGPKSGVYVPPRVTAVPYDDGHSSKKEKTESAKKRALSSSLIQDLRDEYSETPLEIREDSINDWRSTKKREDDAHQQNYEEENFIRLPSKKQKKGNPRASSTLDELTSFSNLSALSGGHVKDGEDVSHRSRSSSGKKKKSKWKRKSSAKKRRIRH